MKALSSCLPLAPLLRAYTDAGVPTGADLGQLPGLGPRFQAVLAEASDGLRASSVDDAREEDFRVALVCFYEACVQPPLHVETVRRRAGMVRHALAHLLRCPDPLPRKAERCLGSGGPYHVPGLGPAFWSALFQLLDPLQHPAWTPAVEVGLRRLGLVRWSAQHGLGQVYAAILNVYTELLKQHPGLSALHLDHFLTLVATMQGRDLWSNAARLDGALPGADLAALIRQERTRVPLRQRLRQRGRTLHDCRRRLEDALRAQDGFQIGQVLSIIHPAGQRRCGIDGKVCGETLTMWVGRLWEADDPYETLEAFWRADPLPGASLWLPAAVLHLRDPRQFHPWDETSRQGYAVLDDSVDLRQPAAARYRLFNEGASWLRDRHRIHPLEVPAVLAAIRRPWPPDREAASEGQFGGFCADTFRFLDELGANNRRDWMEGQRDRYRFAVRAPLVELCRALAERYVEPVLRREHGWDLDTAARSGRALTSVCKNDYGRTVPYHTALWVTFCRHDAGGKRDDVQFFVRLDRAGLSYGLRLGRKAREAGRRFRRHVQDHAELLHRALADSGALSECRFGATEEDLAGPAPRPAPATCGPGPPARRWWPPRPSPPGTPC
jgi:uncharacterized protein (DUF2461 family)